LFSASFIVQDYPLGAVRLYSLAAVYQALRCHNSEHIYLHSPVMAIWNLFVGLFNCLRFLERNAK